MKGNILLIDDDLLFLEVMGHALKENGFNVECAKNGYEAIEKAKGFSFDLIISDVRMPEIDGIETIKEIKKVLPNARNIVITGYADEKAPVLAIKLGVDDYLNKPFKTEELLNSINKSIEILKESREERKLVKQVKTQFLETLKSLLTLFQERDPFKKGHSYRVAGLSFMIAERLGLTLEEKQNLELASYLCDAGMYMIEEELLNKNEIVSEEEIKKIAKHPVLSKELLDPNVDLADVMPLILHHHEFYDGKGYPSGLKGTTIPLGARILSIADAVTALLSPRPYRQAHTVLEVVEFIRQRAGTQFDPEISELAIDILLQEKSREAPDPVSDVVHKMANKEGASLLSLGRFYLEIGDYDVALKAFQEILGLEKSGNKRIISLSYLGCGETHVLLGNLKEGIRNGLKALEMTKQYSFPIISAKAFLFLGKINLLKKEFALARDFLENGLSLFLKSEEAGEILHSRLYLYLLYILEGDSQKGGLEWENCLKEGKSSLQKLFLQENRYIGLFLDAFKDDKKMAEIFNQLVSQGYEKEKRETIQKELLSIYSLGQIKVMREKEWIREDEWKRKKPKNLLIYLLCLKGKSVTEDKLIEDFWPNLPPEKAKNNLYSTISSLRKILEPGLEDGKGSSYISGKKGLYYFNNHSPYWWDVEEFEAAFNKGKELRSTGKHEESIMKFKKMDSLYRGDFLEENPYDDWTLSLRESLKEKEKNGLLYLGEYFHNKKAYDISNEYYHSVLELDPYDEEAHLKTMQNWHELGRREEVIKHYNRCKNILEMDLSIEPSKEIVELYNKVAQENKVDPSVKPPLF